MRGNIWVRVRPALAALAAAVLATGCGGGKGNGSGDDAAVAAGALRAQFEIVSVVNVPEVARATIVAARAEIEAEGHTVADDGSEIRWATVPASGWIVRWGEQMVLTGADGGFVIELPADAPSTGTLAHSQEPQTPLFELRRDQLVAADQTPTPIEITIGLGGPCGMNEDTALEPLGCAEAAAARGHGDEHGHHDHGAHEHHDHAARGHGHHDHGDAPGVIYSMDDPAIAKTDGELGSYPAANQRCCLDYDGGNWDPETWYGVMRNYVGSTCDKLVSNGCCSGELGSVTASVLTKIGYLTPVACRTNHKGRYCQEVSRGDVGFRAPDGTASAYLAGTPGSVEQPVRLGETIDLVVHNNGCFGETWLPKIREEIFGIMSGVGYTPGLIATLTHYTNAPLTYVPDRALAYTAPRCMQSVTGNETDLYYVQADGSTLFLTFRLRTDSLYRFKSTGMVFDAARGPEVGFFIGGPEEPSEANDFIGCPGSHLHGLHPCSSLPDPAEKGCGHGEVEPVMLGN